MQIIRVTDRKTRKKIRDTARIVYKNNETWICPLDNEIEAIFDPGKIIVLTEALI